MDKLFLLYSPSQGSKNNMSRIKDRNRKPLNNLRRRALGGTMILTGIFFYLLQKEGNLIYDYKSVSFISASILVLAGIIAANKFYNTNINNALTRQFESYEKAIANFSISYLMRLVFVIVPTLVAIVMAANARNALLFFPALVGITFIFTSTLKEEHFSNYRYEN